MEWRRFVTYLSNDPRIKSCDITAVLRITDGYVSTKQAGHSLYFTFAGVELAIRTTQLTGTLLENTNVTRR